MANDEGQFLIDALKASLHTYPVEDGISNPAQEIMKEAYLTVRDFDAWVGVVYMNIGVTDRNDSMLADFLQCVGRVQEEFSVSRDIIVWLVKTGLKHPSVGVRESAISIVEQCENRDLALYLALCMEREYEESIGWVANYRDKIISEIKEAYW
jgi:hypothetical protein